MSVTLERNQKLLAELNGKFPGCAAMWRYFLSLTEVPRPSSHCDKAAAWAIEAGKKLGGEVKQDKAGNVCIHFNASAGKEHLPGVVLQAHLDMVPTTSADHHHDFKADPINVWIDGDVIRAKNTTLGADDGSGVAAALALAEDKTLVHGPLDILLTLDEEIGLVGALKLVEGELLHPSSKYLINVDSEDWGEICLSSAGGVDRRLVIPMHRAPADADMSFFELELAQLKGGHSGVEIHAGRGNAVKWVAAMLSENREATAGTPYRIVSFQGGNAHNAIPSKCVVQFGVPTAKADAFLVGVSDLFHLLTARFSHVEKTAVKEPRLTIKPLKPAPAAQPLTFTSSRTALRFIQAIHHGIWAWSEAVPSLVETSQSLSVVKLLENELEAEVFARSSLDSALAVFPRLLEDYAKLYGGKVVQYQDDSPGWPAAPESRLCQSAVKVFRTEFKGEPKLVPIHAGLECGIIISRYPKNKLEAISVGPTVKSPHTVDEHMYLDSAANLYHFLHKLLADLAN